VFACCGKTGLSLTVDVALPHPEEKTTTPLVVRHSNMQVSADRFVTFFGNYGEVQVGTAK